MPTHLSCKEKAIQAGKARHLPQKTPPRAEKAALSIYIAVEMQTQADVFAINLLKPVTGQCWAAPAKKEQDSLKTKAAHCKEVN